MILPRHLVGVSVIVLIAVACSSGATSANEAAETCTTGAACGAGGRVRTCTLGGSNGVCRSIAYRLDDGRAFTCESCESCSRATADVNDACGLGTVAPQDAGTGGTGPSPALCRAGGQRCDTGSECCSNRCVAGTCDPCGAAGDACGAAGCCPNVRPSLTCFRGSCSACLPGGAVCRTTSDCCSQACTGGTCESPPACAAFGAVCTVASDCCDAAAGCSAKACGCNVTQSIPARMPGTSAACVGIIQSACCRQGAACVADGGCVTLVNCLVACGPADLACRQRCATATSAASQTTASQLGSCLTGAGGSACIP